MYVLGISQGAQNSINLAQNANGEPYRSGGVGPVYDCSGFMSDLFASATGRVDEESSTRMWHKLSTSAKVRSIRLHDARQSCGTALHLRGVPMAVIAKWLGHADAATTARIYAHSQDDALRAAGAALGRIVTTASNLPVNERGRLGQTFSRPLG